ncbi:RES family NAD+ phosphorylase [Aeromonas veronii]
MKMISLFRLVRKEFAKSAFDGEGARMHGGRWNSKGKSCIYLGSSRSICVLETLVHLKSQDVLPCYSMFQIDVPDSLVLTLDKAYWPADWSEDPIPASTKELGDDWLDVQDSLILLVPSSIVNAEWNAIMNPNHPDADRIIKDAVEVDFLLDPRLVKGSK